jgi:hypothetical protein
MSACIACACLIFIAFSSGVEKKLLNCWVGPCDDDSFGPTGGGRTTVTPAFGR